MRSIFPTIFFFSFLCITSSSFANNSKTNIERYATIDNIALSAQKDLLSQTIQVRFPQNIQTIGDAMHYVLRYSGYSLVDQAKQSNALQTTLKKPLPVIDRDFGPMLLKKALITLMGPAFLLKNDPLSRGLNFRLKPGYAKYSALFKNKGHVTVS